MKSEILDALHYMQPIEIQKSGIEMALGEEDLSFLLQYSESPEYSNNCAAIFTALAYESCAKYFDELFSWIEDINTPEALRIVEYLSGAPRDLVYRSFEQAVFACLKRKNTANAQTLKMILNANIQLLEMVSRQDKALLNELLRLAEM